MAPFLRRHAESWSYFLCGLPLCGLLTFVPFAPLAGWLLQAVIHEAGHTLFSLFVGMPALPSIDLMGGEAFTLNVQPLPILPWMIWAIVAIGAWSCFRIGDRFVQVIAVAVVVSYPLLAFHETMRSVALLLGGHLAELLFAAIFLVRAKRGWAVASGADRAAASLVGWYLVLSHARLTWGIAYDPQVRRQYEAPHPSGVLNDYVRVAEHWLHVDIKAVALAMFALSLATPMAALALSQGGRSPSRNRLTRGGDGGPTL